MHNERFNSEARVNFYSRRATRELVALSGDPNFGDEYQDPYEDSGVPVAEQQDVSGHSVEQNQ